MVPVCRFPMVTSLRGRLWSPLMRTPSLDEGDAFDEGACSAWSSRCARDARHSHLHEPAADLAAGEEFLDEHDRDAGDPHPIAPGRGRTGRIEHRDESDAGTGSIARTL